FFFPSALIGQFFSGTLTDSITGKPIQDALVVSIPGNQSALSDSLGRFRIVFTERDSLLRISHINYGQTDIPGKLVSPVIKLRSRSTQLSEVIISSKAIIVYESKTYQVLDYAFGKTYGFILAYKDSPEKSTLIILDSVLKPVKSVPVPYPAKRLFKDAFGTIHIICSAQTLQIDLIKNESVINVLFQESTLEAFCTLLQPLTAQNQTHYFYEYYSPSFLSVEYIVLDTRTQRKEKLLTLTDTVRQNMFDDEAHRRLNHERIMESGMGSPAIDFLLKSDPYFAEAVLYKNPVAASLHIINDTIYIFDLCTGDTYVYDRNGKLSRKFKLAVNPATKKPDQIIVDNSTNQAYVLTRDGRNSWLQRINLTNGELSREIKLEFPYPKNIQIHDGWIWYLYRERETFQHTSLYRQPL
ncbi:MAG: hypothetical protein ACRC3B_13850, partial [Bacteroidia bacterium]